MRSFDRDGRARPRLVFSPLAWLKLQYMCHAGDTEVGGFGISAKGRPLYVEDFVTVKQDASLVKVRFDDESVADLFDQCVDRGLEPQQVGRIWIHTHPGSSAEPSGTDEVTFARSFGGCDWSVMAILSRAGTTYARLALAAGPGAEIEIPVQVDWADWPSFVEGHGPSLEADVRAWQEELMANIHRLPDILPTLAGTPVEGIHGADSHINNSPNDQNFLEDRYDRDFAVF